MKLFGSDDKPARPDATQSRINRRQFLLGGAAFLGQAVGLPATPTSRPTPPARTAADLVPLGKTGANICRLGMGTGSGNGDVQRALGQEGFTRLIRHGYEQGLTYVDTADAYQMHDMVRRAMAGLPREKLWIQTKIEWEPVSHPKQALLAVDRFRQELGVDYLDSVLIHCIRTATWDTDLKPVMDALVEAREKKWIRWQGVSIHGLPALARAAECDWPDIVLVRVNPQGHFCDGTKGEWAEPGRVAEAIPHIRKMHNAGKGVIGMKLIGNGDFKSLEERRRSIQFAMGVGLMDAAVIGFKSTAEIDEAIELMNTALAR